MLELGGFVSEASGINPHRRNQMKILKFAAATIVATGVAVAAHAADIVDTAKSAGSYNTLLAAATAAGLVDT